MIQWLMEIDTSPPTTLRDTRLERMDDNNSCEMSKSQWGRRMCVWTQRWQNQGLIVAWSRFQTRGQRDWWKTLNPRRPSSSHLAVKQTSLVEGDSSKDGSLWHHRALKWSQRQELAFRWNSAWQESWSSAETKSDHLQLAGQVTDLPFSLCTERRTSGNMKVGPTGTIQQSESLQDEI